MATSEEVRFYSHGAALAGTLMLPDGAAAAQPVAAVVQGPGWLGLRDAKLYVPYHEALLAAGIAVLVFDYRGFGDSEGDATYLDPLAQVEDYAQRGHLPRDPPEIDPGRIGAFGSGGTGGGNAIYAARPRRRDQGDRQPRSRSPTAGTGCTGCAASTSGSSSSSGSGSTGPPRRRTGEGELVAPRDGIMVPTPERRTTTVKATSTTGSRRRSTWPAPRRSSPTARSTWSTGSRRGPLMLICVENDATTPEDHALRPVRAGGRAEAARRPDRHDPLRGLRPVPRPGQPADRRAGSTATSWAARSTSTSSRAGGDRPDLSSDRRQRDGADDPPLRHAASAAAPSSPRPGSTAADVAISGRPDRGDRGTGYAARGRRGRSTPTGRHVLPGRNRRPLPPPRAGLHPQGGHRQRDERVRGGRRDDLVRDAQRRSAAEHRRAARRDDRAVRAQGDRRLEHQRRGDRRSTRSRRWPTRGIAAFKVFMVVDTGRDYPHMPGIGVHDHGKLLEIFETDRADRPAAHGPSPRPGPDGPHRGRASGPAASATRWPTPRRTPPTTGSSGTRRRRSCSGSSRRPGTPLHLLHTQTTGVVEQLRRGQGARPGRHRPSSTRGPSSWATTGTTIERLGSYALSLLRPREEHRAALGGAGATARSTSSRPTTRRTLREEKEPGWTDGWKAHTGTPSTQFYVPAVPRRRRRRAISPRAGRRRSSPPRRRGASAWPTRAASRSARDADIAIVDLDAEFEIRDEIVLSKIGYTPVRRAGGCAASSRRRSCAAASSTSTARSSATPGWGRQARPAR